MDKLQRFFQISLLFVCLVPLTMSAQVMFNGKKAAIDDLTDTWLLTVPEAAFGTDYCMTISLDDGVTRCYIDGNAVDRDYTFINVRPGATYHLWALSGADTITANVQFTYWPVIQIYGNYTKRPYYNGTVIYSHPDSAVQESIISRVRWAGSSTAGADRKKHNFHLKFYNEDGSKKNMSFWGLRSDFHWRLDAGQVDFSRVRNRVAKDVWADFATQPYYAAYEPKVPHSYVRGDFVEVFLNDQYMGIYSLNEHMDRQQLKLKQYDYANSEFHGGLWKPMSMSYVTLFAQLLDFDSSSKTWDQFYVKYPNIDDVNPTNFNTLAEAVKFSVLSSDAEFLDSAQYYFDIPVFRDYYLFLLLMQAPDNIGKNVYYACHDVAADKRLTIAIWDLDCTQGQFYSNQGSNYHHELVSPEYDMKNNQLVRHNVMRRLWQTDSTFHNLAMKRYWQLRATTFNPDSILNRYRNYFDEMKRCGADQREIARWSYGSDLGGRQLDFDNELEYIRDWWTRHIDFLDNNTFAPQAGDVNGDGEINIADVTTLIRYILTQNVVLRFLSADLDGSGVINVADVVVLINEVLRR